MGRKNRRIEYDLYLPPIKDERRRLPRCPLFPNKTSFASGYGAQEAIDEIRHSSDRDKVPERVYECLIDDGGCGYFHITSIREIEE